MINSNNMMQYWALSCNLIDEEKHIHVICSNVRKDMYVINQPIQFDFPGATFTDVDVFILTQDWMQISIDIKLCMNEITCSSVNISGRAVKLCCDRISNCSQR